MKVELVYFKAGGKYYSEGSYLTNHTELWEVVNEIKEMRNKGELPGLIAGASDFMIHVVVKEVPHIIPLYVPLK